MLVQYSLQVRLAALSLGDLWLARLQEDGDLRSDATFDLEMADEVVADELVAVKRHSEQAGPTRFSAALREHSTVQHIMQLGPHRNIVRFFSAEIVSDPAFMGDTHVQLAMEFCSGGDLFQMLANRPDSRVPETHALDIIAQVAAALAFLHDNGVTHGNLSLENVLIDAHGVCKLSDFRLARCDTSSTRIALGGMLGSPDFLPPELRSDLGDASEIDPIKTDIWALGVMLFVLMTGMALVNQGTGGQLAFQALQTLGCQGALRVWRLDTLISPETTAMLDKLIAVNPASRFSSMQEVQRSPGIAARAL